MSDPTDSIDTLLGGIREALVLDAAPELRARAAVACRAILQQLEPGTTTTSPRPPAAPPLPPEAAAFVEVFRGMPQDQLLDLAIARLRAALPAGVEVDPVKPLKFHLIPVPPAKPPSR